MLGDGTFRGLLHCQTSTALSLTTERHTNSCLRPFGNNHTPVKVQDRTKPPHSPPSPQSPPQLTLCPSGKK